MEPLTIKLTFGIEFVSESEVYSEKFAILPPSGGCNFAICNFVILFSRDEDYPICSIKIRLLFLQILTTFITIPAEAGVNHIPAVCGIINRKRQLELYEL